MRFQAKKDVQTGKERAYRETCITVRIHYTRHAAKSIHIRYIIYRVKSYELLHVTVKQTSVKLCRRD